MVIKLSLSLHHNNKNKLIYTMNTTQTYTMHEYSPNEFTIRCNGKIVAIFYSWYEAVTELSELEATQRN